MIGNVPVQKQGCSNCRFWRFVVDLENDAGSIGMCRRHAPGVSIHSEHSVSFPLLAIWPVTSGRRDWCGEWRQD